MFFCSALPPCRGNWAHHRCLHSSPSRFSPPRVLPAPAYPNEEAWLHDSPCTYALVPAAAHESSHGVTTLRADHLPYHILFHPPVFSQDAPAYKLRLSA